MPAGAVDKRRFPILEHLRRAHLERERGGRRCLWFNAPDLDLWFEGLERARDARDQTTTANAGDDRSRVRRVFKNLEPHCSVARDEIVIVEWMDERSVRSRERAVF